MRKIFICLFFLVKISIYANDGGVAIRGGSIFPVNITNVSMDYERLIITCKERYFEVEAYIELFNHDDRAIEHLLGFEFFEGTLVSHQRDIDRIKQYTLFVNNEPQNFEYGVQEIENIHTLVYKPILNPGKNIIYHKHQLPYGGGSMEGGISYILKTSSRWKDGIIKEIDIFIKTEITAILLVEEFVYHDFAHGGLNYLTEYETIGESKLYSKYSHRNNNGVGHYEYYSITPNGYLHRNMQNFIPNKNIWLQLFNWHGVEMYWSFDDPPYNWPRENAYITIHDWKAIIENPNFRRYRWGDNWAPSEAMLNDLSTEQLRILRNSIFAIHGLVFNDPFLRDYFNKQYWYFPNPNISQPDVVLSDSERRILNYIITEERRR